MRARIKPVHFVTKKQKAAVNEYVQEELRVHRLAAQDEYSSCFVWRCTMSMGLARVDSLMCWKRSRRCARTREMTLCFGVIWIEPLSK